MPVKIGFTVISSTGEDERYRATELNYHGPTVRGWRSAMNCSYPQEIVLQLNITAVLHRIQILSHQYLITQKIELWISEGFDYDPSLSPAEAESFEYLGFITLSDNQSTAFKSRELKSITVPPTAARYLKLRLHSNHINEKNVYNQVGLIAVNVLGDEVQELDADGDEVNNNGNYFSSHPSESTLISNPQYLSPYDDLAFEMYVDRDVAKIMRIMEAKKHQAVLEERFEYASKLKLALEDLKEAGEVLGKFEQEKKQAINTEDYDKAKMKKLQIDKYREQVYSVLQIDQLLELDGPAEENDVNCGSHQKSSIARKRELAPPPLEALEPEKSGKGQRGTPSPNGNEAQAEGEEDKADWSFFHSQSYYRPTKSQFNYCQTSNHLIHSQSQTSFDRCSSNREESPPLPLAGQCLSATFSNPQLTDYQAHIFPTPRFQLNVPMYSSNMWQPSTSNHETSEMYHSMPTAQMLDPKPHPLSEKYNTAEFQVPQRTYPPEERRNQPAAGQKAVDFDSPVAQTMDAAVENDVKSLPTEGDRPRPKSPSDSSTSKSPPANAIHRPNNLRGSLRRRNKSTGTLAMKSSYEAYEERMLPALRHYHVNEIVRECQLGLVEQTRKSKLNEREKKQAALPISVFGIELVEKFYSKHFADKEEGLKQLQEHLKREVHSDGEKASDAPRHSPNKTARAAIFLLHRALRDKVYSVYSSAADTIRIFFSEYVPKRVSSAEVARSVERLLPELIAKSGDSTPRIHNMAAHTLLSMADCKEVRELHIIPVHLSRPLTSSVHPRLALSRLEMIEQLILNQGISTDKQSGLTCRTLAEFGSSGLHHPAEAVRKVSERILIQVYRVNPRLVRKQLPPDDDITRRNLLYRQLFQEFDFMDMQRKRELCEKTNRIPSIGRSTETHNKAIQPHWNNYTKQDGNENESAMNTAQKGAMLPASTYKRTVNQQTSPMKPYGPACYYTSTKEATPCGVLGNNGTTKDGAAKSVEKEKIILPSREQSRGSACNGEHKANGQFDKRKAMSRIIEEKVAVEERRETPQAPHSDAEKKEAPPDEDVTLKFPNLVDSVRVTEERMSFAQKGIRNLKSLKYIFPTSYIGNSTTSQAAVNSSNSVNTFCKITKKSEWCTSKTQAAPYSGIPVPVPNGRQGTGPLAPLASAKKLAKDPKPEAGGNKMKTVNEKVGNDDEEGEQEERGREWKAEGRTSEASDSKRWAEETESRERSEGPGVGGEGPPTSATASPGKGEDPVGSRGRKREQNETFRMCIFCFASDKWFTEESLNQHYWSSCPMLTRCNYCNEVVEVSGLIQHRLEDCEQRNVFVKCEICQEAVERDGTDSHKCVASESQNPKTRCPLCHTHLESEDDWREHLMGVKICPNHPRRPAEDQRPAMASTGED